MTISVQNLSYAYGRLQALADISAEARPGRITAVVGPNASGKSTLLQCLIGALHPPSGVALIDGQAAHQLTARQLARLVAYVPQRAVVSAAFTVRQVVELGRYALPADARRIDEALQRLALRELADRPYRELSVGQQQRVTFARALAQAEPDGHLVLDEPTSAMDLRHEARALDLLRQLARDGTTIIIAMHDISRAAALADDAWLLSDGRLIATGAAGDVLTPERLEAVFGIRFERFTTRNGEVRLVPNWGGSAAAS